MENLLTSNQKEVLKRGYKRRLIIISSWVFAAAMLVAFVLSTPVYIANRLKLDEVKSRNDVNNQALSDQSEILAVPSVLNQKAKAILSYSGIVPASSRFAEIMDSLPPGVALNEISFRKYNPADKKGAKTDEISISGTALNRETLLSLQENLKKVDFVGNISIPVESFARPKDLPFTITIAVKGK